MKNLVSKSLNAQPAECFRASELHLSKQISALLFLLNKFSQPFTTEVRDTNLNFKAIYY